MTQNHSPMLVAEKWPEVASPEQEFVGYDLGNPETPVYQQKAEIIDALNENQVVIVVAATGSGKSTQLPQIGIEAGFRNVILTQPRRQAANNVANRIYDELSSSLGPQEAESLVSCQTGAGLTGLYEARIKVVTDGLHLIRDGHDDLVRGKDMWVIDEVHEWNSNIEMLAALGMQRAEEDPDFRMVIMSATMQKEELVKYYRDNYDIEPAVVEVYGKMYDVKTTEAPGSTVAEEAIRAAKEIFYNPEDQAGSNTIQVFVAGKQEIYDTLDNLIRNLPPEVLAKSRLIPLHAKMPRAAQAPAYEDYDGIKIIVETKMGQTSVTIPGTRYVISSGLERRIELDEEGSPGLMLRPVSRDDLSQQAGRTGRTNDGTFVLTRQSDQFPFISFDQRPENPVPEVQRTQLDRLVLYQASHGQDIEDLQTFHEIPATSIGRAKRRLRVLGAINGSDEITKLGRRMMTYPLTPARAKSMIHAEHFSPNVRSYMSMIVAAKEVGGIRLFERQRGRRWEALSQEATSDDLFQLDVFIAAQDMTYEKMDEHDLDINNVEMAREHYRKVARRAGADPDTVLKVPTETEREQLRECILAGSVNDIFLPDGPDLWRLLGDSVVRRELSNRSAVQAAGSALVGDPRRVETKRDGEPETKHIIEDATKVSLEAVGRVATHLVGWHPTGFRMRGGRFVQVETQKLDVFSLGEREVPAEPSPRLRETIINFVKTNPGPHLKELYQIKRSLEKLAHKSKHPIERLTEENIDRLIAAAAPPTITDPSLIDNNLRVAIAEQGISIDSFVSPEVRQRIEASAPTAVSINGFTIGLRYQSGKPIVKKYSLDMIAVLDEDVQLSDGRIAYFYDLNGKPRTLMQLKNRLIADGLI